MNKKPNYKTNRTEYRALTVMLLRIRNEVFANAGMSKECFTRTYLSGLGRYERKVAKEEGIEL